MAANKPTSQRLVRGVALGETFDILAHFGEGIMRHRPNLELLSPDEVGDPAAIEFALVFDPADDAFTPYPNLRFICSVSVAAHQLVSCPSLPTDVPITRVISEAQEQTMAGFVAWHVLWHHRHFDTYLRQQHEHRWRNLNYRAPSDMQVTILGYGHMGRAVAAALLPMGYRVAGVRRSHHDTSDAIGVEVMRGQAGLDNLLPRTDILINLLPLTPKTQGLLAKPLFERLPKDAVLIHLGRGEQLVEADLLKALDRGHLAGASLDVFASEPLPPEHPFWDHSNVLITPHDACRPTPQAVAEHLEECLRRVEAGEPLEPVVDSQRGY